jgi:hypothetical protein
MFELSSDSRKEELSKATPAQKEARERMALFPIASGGHGSDGGGGARSELIFVAEDKWVPVLRLGGKVCSLRCGKADRDSFACFPVSPACSSNCCSA